MNPNWWHHAAGVSFDRSFYLDSETRIQNDLTMRRTLYEHFGDMGLGEADPKPRPIVFLSLVSIHASHRWIALRRRGLRGARAAWR